VSYYWYKSLARGDKFVIHNHSTTEKNQHDNDTAVVHTA